MGLGETGKRKAASRHKRRRGATHEERLDRTASQEPAEPFDPPDRSRVDRPARPSRLEIGGELRRGCVAVLGVLLERLRHDRIEVAADPPGPLPPRLAGPDRG